MFLKIIFGVLVLVGFYAYFIYQGGLSVKGPIITKKEGVTIPQKTEFGSQLPTGFLSTIPLEAKAALTQSYGLDYGAQKQLTAVFDSSKTVSQNYVLYAKFLTSNDWILQNTHTKSSISLRCTGLKILQILTLR